MTDKIDWNISNWSSLQLQCSIAIDNLPSVNSIQFCIEKKDAGIKRFILKVKGSFSGDGDWLNEIQQELSRLDSQLNDKFYLKKNKKIIEGFELISFGFEQDLFIQQAQLVLKKAEINSIDQLKISNFLKSGLFDEAILIEKMNGLLSKNEFKAAFDFALYTEKMGHANMLFRLGVLHFKNNLHHESYTVFSAINSFSEDYSDAQINAIKCIATTNEVKLESRKTKTETIVKHCQNISLSGRYLATFKNNKISIEKSVPQAEPNPLIESNPIIASPNVSTHFDLLPLELSLEIFDRLSPKALFTNCRTINKDLRLISELALLRKRSAESVPYQHMLMKSYIMDVEQFRNRPEWLKNELVRSLYNPRLSYQYRLYGYFLISSLKSEVLLEEDSMKWLTELINTKSFKASKRLSVLIPLLSPQQVTTIFPILKEKIGDDYYLSSRGKNQKEISQCLKLLAPQLNDLQITQILVGLLKSLNHGKKKVLYEICQFITILQSRFNEGQAAQLCIALADKLENMEENVAEKAFRCLEGLMPRLSDKQVYDLISTIIKQLNHRFIQPCESAYQGLSLLVPKLNEKLLESILPLILEHLSRFKDTLNPSGTLFFTALGARLTDNQVDMLFEMLSQAMDEKWVFCPYTMCQFLTGLAPRLNQSQIDVLYPRLLRKLRGSGIVAQAASECFAVLAPSLNQNQIDELFPKLLETLTNRDLGLFIIFLPRLNDTQLAMLMESLIKQLNTTLQYENIDAFLRALGGVLNDTQFHDFYLILLKNVNDIDKQHAKGACLYLRALMSRFNDEQKKELLTKITKILMEKNEALSHIWEVLKALDFKLDEIQITFLFERLIERMDDNDSWVAHFACDQIVDLAPQLSKEQVETFFCKLMENLEHTSSYERYLACHGIREIIPQLHSKQIELLIPKLQYRFYNDKGVRQVACFCLKILIPQLTDEQKQSLHDFIIKILSGGHQDTDKEYEAVRNGALELASMPDMLNFKTYTCKRMERLNKQSFILGWMNSLFSNSSLYIARQMQAARVVRVAYPGVKAGGLDFLKVLGRTAKAKCISNEGACLENSPLHEAISALDVNKVKELANKERIKLKDKNGDTPLVLAVKSNDENTSAIAEVIRHLLNYEPPLEDLHRAISILLKRNGAFEAIQMLLAAWRMRENSKNYQVYNTYTNENTPWYSAFVLMAMRTAHPVETLHLLYTCGADLNVVDNVGNSLLHLAILQLSRGFTGYYKERFDEVIHYLLHKKVNINIRNDCGDTPLHYATKFENVPLVKKLIEHKAKVYCLNNEQITPLDLARRECPINWELCTLLGDDEYTNKRPGLVSRM